MMAHELRKSEAFVLLGSRRRRHVLDSVRESSTRLTAFEIAGHIADREYDDPSANDISTIHTTLQHNHLPRLE